MIHKKDYNKNRIMKMIDSISTIDNDYDEHQTEVSIHLSEILSNFYYVHHCQSLKLSQSSS